MISVSEGREQIPYFRNGIAGRTPVPTLCERKRLAGVAIGIEDLGPYVHKNGIFL